MANELPEIDGFFIPREDAGRLPSILARWFACADSEQQQRFLEHLYDEFNAWGKPPEFQWDFWRLSTEAKWMLSEMASHAGDAE